ncbi:MAG: hypothetical protein GX896_03035 [Clostridiales bacterium]|nr:hypothetical protein [Clostridiales bacterium]
MKRKINLQLFADSSATSGVGSGSLGSSDSSSSSSNFNTNTSANTRSNLNANSNINNNIGANYRASLGINPNPNSNQSVNFNSNTNTNANFNTNSSNNFNSNTNATKQNQDTTALYSQNPNQEALQEIDEALISPMDFDAKHKAKRFERLIKGEFKDAFNQRVQKIVDKRFAKTKGLEKELSDTRLLSEQSTGLVNALAKRYGVESSDLNGIMEALALDGDDVGEIQTYDTKNLENLDESDDLAQLVEKLTQLNGETMEFYENPAQPSQEPARLEANENLENQSPDLDFAIEQKALDTAFQWQEQAEQLRQRVPDFDIAQEVANPQFAKMLQSGVDVETAFRAIHMESILGGAMEKTAQSVAEKIARGRELVSRRPSEIGTTSHTGVLAKVNVKELTPRERQDIAKRAAGGETISF